ncbi:xanthotoxin 5-hydroxylase CYP82C4-like isoform X2 [Tasmannia lanceolata]|uniref:xanthotoxin 5-hydroxylase CYP82C4-like isoform X2 n=1 Tax=Tasmannia lanceolata TaxID=3420 RepID=UPI0040634F19
MDFILHMQSIAGLIAVVLLYKLWIARTKSRSKEAPEAAGAWPVIGHLHLLGRGAPLFRTLGVMADKYGPTFTIWLGMRRTLIVSSWEVCKECFTTNDKVLADRPTFVAGELLGYNYAMFGFAPYGPYWREIRKIATLEVLSNRRLELLKHIRVMEIDMCIRDLYGVWVKKNRQPVMVEMKQWFGNLTMNVVVKMVTGKRYTGGEGDDQSLILGGTDTTAVTLAWALSLLLNNSHVLKKAQDELDIHVGKDRHVDESDINNLVYLQAIFKETMRLYPAPLAVPHSATEDCQVDGFHVPAGTLVMVNLWKLQRDPRVWSDPLEFRPERFLTSHVDVDVRGQHFEYIPFGSGRRSCPGISFALQVMHLALARLLHGFDMSTPSGGPVNMSEGLGLSITKAGPLEVLLTGRLPSKLYE